MGYLMGLIITIAAAYLTVLYTEQIENGYTEQSRYMAKIGTVVAVGVTVIFPFHFIMHNVVTAIFAVFFLLAITVAGAVLLAAIVSDVWTGSFGLFAYYFNTVPMWFKWVFTVILLLFFCFVPFIAFIGLVSSLGLIGGFLILISLLDNQPKWFTDYIA